MFGRRVPLPLDENYWTYKHHRLAAFTHLASNLTHSIIKWGSLVIIAYFFVGGLKELAGRETLANVVLTFAAGLHADKWIALILTGGGIGYGLNERRNRKKTVRNLTGRIAQLESLLDPNRTSSTPPLSEK